MNRDVIKENVLKGQKANIYSYIIVYNDKIDESFKFWYVEKDRDINIVLANILNLNFNILEVYNYRLDIEEQLKSYDEKSVNSLSIKALKFATRMHEDQTRKDGTPYIEHPKRVAEYVKYYKSHSTHLDILTAAAYLHDTLEDTNLSYYDLVEFFGPTVAGIVLELTTDNDLREAVGKTKYLEIKCKNMSSWAFTIKLCDRLDNISDLETSNEEFRKRYVNETLEIINYVINNRNLTKTQMKIINDILFKINSVRNILPDDLKEKNDKVYKMTKSIKC